MLKPTLLFSQRRATGERGRPTNREQGAVKEDGVAIAGRKSLNLCALAAAAALVAGTTACGGSGGGSAGGKTLTMWTFKQTHVKALEAAAAAFKAKTGITVKITAYTPDATFTSKVQSAAATHNVADVLEDHAGGEDFVFGGAGILTDLAPSVDTAWKARFLAGTADTGLVTDTVYQASLKPKATDPGVKKGQLFSVPFTAGTFGIVYADKTKLKAAGIDPAKPPKTWEGLISWIKAVHDRDPQAGGITLGLNVSSTGLDWALEPLAYAYLGKSAYQALFAKDASAAWGSPNGQKVLELYNELTPYWTPGSQTLGIDDADRAFAQGKSAFDIGGTFTMASIQQDGLSPSDLVAFGLPAPAGGAVSDLKLAPIALTGLSISAQSKNQSADLQWIDFLTTQAQAGAFAQASYDLPATDLGANSAALVGPDLSSLEAVFGSGDGAYNPGDSTFMGPTWDITQAGDLVVQMSPLREQSPASTNAKLGAFTANTRK
jgi:multiple sugar transport system substrate-binding protein